VIGDGQGGQGGRGHGSSALISMEAKGDRAMDRNAPGWKPTRRTTMPTGNAMFDQLKDLADRLDRPHRERAADLARP